MGTGLAALMGFRRKYLGAGLKRLLKNSGSSTTIALALCCLMLVLSAAPAAKASVKLDTWTNPPSGAAGSSNTNIVGTAFPAGTIAPASVNTSIATSCSASLSGTGATKTTALRVTKVLGTSERIEFSFPPVSPALAIISSRSPALLPLGRPSPAARVAPKSPLQQSPRGSRPVCRRVPSAYSPGPRPCKLMSRMVVGVVARPASNTSR